MDCRRPRDFMVAAGALLALPLAAEAQQAGKVACLGHLAPNLAANRRSS